MDQDTNSETSEDPEESVLESSPENQVPENQVSSPVQNLPVEVLTSIFKRTDSKDMVKIRRVQSQWSEIIDEDDRLWRRFNLVIPTWKRWDEKARAGLEMFDQMCDGTMTDFSLTVQLLSEEEEDSILAVLLESKETLRNFYVKITSRQSTIQTEGILLSCNMTQFTKLVDFRIDKVNERVITNVNRIHREVDDEESKLRILWTSGDLDDDLGWYDVDVQYKDFFKNLESLCLYTTIDSSMLREVLEGPCKSLKHLRVAPLSADTHIESLFLPRLQILELFTYDGYECEFDSSWIETPSNTIVISDSDGLPDGLPSTNSELWVYGLDNWQNLTSSCPLLETLRLENKFEQPDADYLIYLLEERRKNVEKDLEVEGVKMVNIKKVIIEFKNYPKTWIERVLRPLVEEVIDLKTLSKDIEVVI